MRYALPMSSSFVYQPHVQQSDGSVITPDILIERVYASGADGALSPVPVSRVTSAAVLQQSAGAPMGVPAVVLVAASYGLLVSVGALVGGFLPVARAAWRFDDIRDGYGDIVLRSWAVHDDKRTAFVAEKLSALTSPADTMAALGNASGLKPGTAVFIGHPVPLGESLSVERFEVALTADNEELACRVDIETIG
ncbi:MAG: hypothetical protein ACI9JL_002340 [Paracoccaceae bacterium]|jgi:hypothetical protein